MDPGYKTDELVGRFSQGHNLLPLPHHAMVTQPAGMVVKTTYHDSSHLCELILQGRYRS